MVDEYVDGDSHRNVLFLGPCSSFSHAASIALFPDSATLHPAPDFPSIFIALQDAASVESWSDSGVIYDYAVIPIRNSTNGPVKPVVELLQRTGNGAVLQQLSELGLSDLQGPITHEVTTSADYGQPETESIQHSSTLDRNEMYPDLTLAPPYTYALSVHHDLYVHASCPIATFTSDDTTDDASHLISSLHTHPQVWTQCTRFLSHYFPYPSTGNNDAPEPPSLGHESLTLPTATDESITQRFAHASTSEAALYVASNPPSSFPVHPSSSDINTIKTGQTRWPAAICSTLAGTAHHLKRIAANIEDDREGNQTTFIILRNSRRGD